MSGTVSKKVEGERRIIRYRLYPTAIQEKKLDGMLGACRHSYNALLEFFKYYSRKPNNDDMRYFRYELMERCAWYRDYDIDTVYDQVLQGIRGNLNSLRALRKNGRKTGELRFKKRGEYNSLYSRHIKLDTMTGRLYLAKLGWIQMKMDREPMGQVVIVRIIKEINSWFVNVCYAIKGRVIHIGTKREGAIDVGLDNFYYDSDGNSVKRPKFLKPNIRKLRLLGRKLSRKRGQYNQQSRKKQTPSNNYHKAQTRLQILHAKIRKKREDFLHKESTKLASRYDRVFVEKLKIQNMSRNRHLSQAIMDAGWYKFKQLLSYKTEVVEVAPHYTSQTCSGCGNKMKIGLSVRTYVCPCCGLVLPRDHNSAITILANGRSDLARKRSTDAQSGTAEKPATPVEIGVSGTTHSPQPVKEAGIDMHLKRHNNNQTVQELRV